MKFLILASLFFTSFASAELFIIGEQFEDSPWAKPGKFTKVEKHAIKGSEDIVYKITQSNLPNLQTLVSVSARTKQIYRYVSSGSFESIYQAVSFASTVCRGEVFLPDRAVRGLGFPLQNVPAEENEGKNFDIFIQPVAGTPYFTLSIDCYDYK